MSTCVGKIRYPTGGDIEMSQKDFDSVEYLAHPGNCNVSLQRLG